MKLLDLTLPTPAENVALDEALVEQAELSTGDTEVLRLWESPQPFAVIGRASRIEQEVRRDLCLQRGIPVLRRCSGGAAIVTGPGCLMYAVVLSYDQRPDLRMIDRGHRFVLERHARALSQLGADVICQGISDLAIGDRKISGNSMRCKRAHMLYHGTVLYEFPLELIGGCLKTPPRQPDYRRNRQHAGFVENFPAGAETIRRVLIQAWDAAEQLKEWPRELTTRLVAQRYSRDDWNTRL